jgi:hypothetical protein
MKKNKMNVPSIDVIVGDNPVKFIPLKRQLEILNREVSQPDSEGWWWYSYKGVSTNSMRQKCVYISAMMLFNWDKLTYSLLKARWIKAIVPEFKEE